MQVPCYGQFIPSSYRSYAVDFDGDGVRDIWSNKIDAIGSVANYFAQNGWSGRRDVVERERGGGNGGTEVPGQRSTEAHTHGRRVAGPGRASECRAAGESCRDTDENAATLSAEYWLGFEDFYAITRYNHSRPYAMAVYQLSQAIVERRENQASPK